MTDRVIGGHKVEARISWSPAEENDARILSGPNLPKPLHGDGCNPRTIMGATAWNKMRKRTYYLANYKCQVCGRDCSEPGTLDSHELYRIDYMTGRSVFVRTVALCKECHSAYHSGRSLTLWKNKSFFMPTSRLLGIAEHTFKLIYEWNKAHPDEKKLKAYETFLNFLEHEELAPTMENLIKKYKIEFWGEDLDKRCKWGDWALVFGTREYPTPYKGPKEWEEAMRKRDESDTMRNTQSPFTGGVYDEINSLLS